MFYYLISLARQILVCFILLLSAACSDGDSASDSGTDTESGGDADSDTDGDTDSDSDGDGDTDSDTDSDTDGDSDTGQPTDGCGVPWEPVDGELEDDSWLPDAIVVRREMTVAGVQRQYMVAVSPNYDENDVHALVIGFHGSGGDREQLRRYVNLEGPAAGNAVFIYPEGLSVDGGSTGWDLDQESDDLIFVDNLIEKYAGELCIDRNRIFATGHSYGGCMSNSVGCYRGDVFRAIGPIAGCGPFTRDSTCAGKFAAILIHSPKDTATNYGGAIQNGCNTWLRQNNCDENPECGCHWVDELDAPEDECVQLAQEPYVTEEPIEVTEYDEKPPELRQYMNCDAGYPVVFIDHWNFEDERYHNPPDWVPGVLWEFFNNLPAIE